MRTGMEEAFSNSGAGDSAVGKLQRRLPGTAPQNGAPPIGLPQRMGQLQPPCRSCELRDCLRAGSSTGEWPRRPGWDRAPTEQPWAQ